MYRRLIGPPSVGFSSKIYEWVRTFNAFELAGGCHRRRTLPPQRPLLTTSHRKQVRIASLLLARVHTDEGDSLERIEQYLDIEREEELMGAETVEDLDGSWPRSGDLQVKNLRASYGEYENTPEVLKGISFTVKSGERIGVGEFPPVDLASWNHTDSTHCSWSHWQRQGKKGC